MAQNENVFNFDVKPFLDGIKRIGDGMGSVEKNAKKFGDTITNSIGKAVNGTILKVGALFAAFKSVGAVLKEMPEVGQAFGIAKDIFLKNLLWPLRQQVMPMLQKMLDWVRDHRAEFVKWGVAITNIFRSVVTVAKTLWDVMKSLVEVVGNAFQRAFNTNFKSFDEFVNVLSFKISAVIIYFGMLAKQLVIDLKPAFEWIMDMGASIIDFFIKLADAWGTANKNGDSLWTVMDKLKTTMTILADAVRAAWEGFKEGFLSSSITEAMTPLTNLVDTLNRLLTAVGLKDTEGLRSAFKGLGQVIGTDLEGSLVYISRVFDTLTTTLETLVDIIKTLKLMSEGDWAGAAKQFQKVGTNWTAFGERTGKDVGSMLPETIKKPKDNTEFGNTVNMITAVIPGKTDDALVNWLRSLKNGKKHEDVIITKTGEVHETSPDDNILAAKNLSAYGGKKKGAGELPSMNFGPFYVSVMEGDAEQAGRDFGQGLAYSFRDNVSHARLAEGW